VALHSPLREMYPPNLPFHAWPSIVQLFITLKRENGEVNAKDGACAVSVIACRGAVESGVL
jgi:hypothetical protein